jgi:hypothetical protein
VNQRHLLPEEFDQLLENEEDSGADVSRLREHLSLCAACHKEFRSLQRIVGTLENLPYVAPNPLLAERVMTGVKVTRSWYVNARDLALRMVPKSRGSRAGFAVVGAAGAAVTTLLAMWAAQRTDAVLFLAALTAEQAKGAMLSGARTAGMSFLGEPLTSMIERGGPLGVAGAVAGVAGSMAASAFVVRSLTNAGARRRG